MDKKEFISNARKYYDKIPVNFIRDFDVNINSHYGKEGFLKKLEENYELLPKKRYVENRFKNMSSEIEEKKQIEVIMDCVKNNLSVIPESKNYDLFIKKKWLVDYIKEVEGLNVSLLLVNRVIRELGYKKGSFYFNSVGVVKGFFASYKDSYVKDFFAVRRSFDKINKNG